MHPPIVRVFGRVGTRMYHIKTMAGVNLSGPAMNLSVSSPLVYISIYTYKFMRAGYQQAAEMLNQVKHPDPRR